MSMRVGLDEAHRKIVAAWAGARISELQVLCLPASMFEAACWVLEKLVTVSTMPRSPRKQEEWARSATSSPKPLPSGWLGTGEGQGEPGRANRPGS